MRLHEKSLEEVLLDNKKDENDQEENSGFDPIITGFLCALFIVVFLTSCDEMSELASKIV